METQSILSLLTVSRALIIFWQSKNNVQSNLCFVQSWSRFFLLSVMMKIPCEPSSVVIRLLTLCLANPHRKRSATLIGWWSVYSSSSSFLSQYIFQIWRVKWTWLPCRADKLVLHTSLWPLLNFNCTEFSACIFIRLSVSLRVWLQDIWLPQLPLPSCLKTKCLLSWIVRKHYSFHQNFDKK